MSSNNDNTNNIVKSAVVRQKVGLSNAWRTVKATIVRGDELVLVLEEQNGGAVAKNSVDIRGAVFRTHPYPENGEDGGDDTGFAFDIVIESAPVITLATGSDEELQSWQAVVESHAAAVAVNDTEARGGRSPHLPSSTPSIAKVSPPPPASLTKVQSPETEAESSVKARVVTPTDQTVGGTPISPREGADDGYDMIGRGSRTGSLLLKPTLDMRTFEAESHLRPKEFQETLKASAERKSRVLRRISSVADMSLREKKEEQKKIRTEEVESKCHIMHPHYAAVGLWKFFECIIVQIMIVTVPLNLAFRDELGTYTGLVDIFAYLVDIVFLIDFVVFTFFVGYYFVNQSSDKTLVTNIKKIAVHAMFHGNSKGTENTGSFSPRASQQASGRAPMKVQMSEVRGAFLADLLSALPIDTCMRLAGNHKLAAYFRLLRLLRSNHLSLLHGWFHKMTRKCGDSIQMLELMFQLLALFLALFLINHYLCCMLFLSGQPDHEPSHPSYALCELEDDCGWVQRSNFHQNTSFAVKYTSAFYFSFTIITSVGFGDIIPERLFERLVVVFVQAIGVFGMAFLLGKVTVVLQEWNTSHLAYTDMVTQVRHFMSAKKTSNYLRRKVFEYYEMSFPNGQYFDEGNILALLPHSMRLELLDDMYGSILEELPFVPMLPQKQPSRSDLLETRARGRPDDSRLVYEELLKCLRPRTYLDNENIVMQGELGDSLFVISNGKVGVYGIDLDKDTVEEFTIRIMSQGDFFGEQSALKDEVSIRTCTCRAVTGVSAVELYTCDIDLIRETYEVFDTKIRNFMTSKDNKFNRPAVRLGMSSRNLLAGADAADDKLRRGESGATYDSDDSSSSPSDEGDGTAAKAGVTAGDLAEALRPLFEGQAAMMTELLAVKKRLARFESKYRMETQAENARK